MKVKVGERWLSGSDRKSFTVIAVLEQDGKTWIHYRDDFAKQYSCWEESFLHRFSKDETWNGHRYI